MDFAATIITGGVFTVTNNNWPPLRWDPPLRSSRTMDRFLEAVAPSAFHDSVERSDLMIQNRYLSTVAHAAAAERVRQWAAEIPRGTVYNHHSPSSIHSVADHMPMLWLTGYEGSGKSILVQRIVEDLDAQRRLLASFFFDGSDATRNHPRALVATLAYQIYQTLPPAFQDRILAVIERDPLIFRRSMVAQFERLILAPLHELIISGYFDGITTPKVVVIDGLDECVDTVGRRSVLDMISNALIQHRLPFIFLISSHPEMDITAFISFLGNMAETIALERGQISVAPTSENKEQDQRDVFLSSLTDHPYNRYHDMPFTNMLFYINSRNFLQSEGEPSSDIGRRRD